MELRHLRYFLAVAEERNFTRAAARVGIGQPPLSQQIRDLEAEVGAPLFHRVPHGAELTEAGKAFLEVATGILAQADQAKTAALRAARGETGRLRVGFTGSAAFNPVVPGRIRAYRRACPGVDLSLSERNTVQLIEALHKGDIDIGFIRPGTENPDGLRLYRFADEPMVIAVPAAHPIAKLAEAPLSRLAKEPFVLYPRAVCLGLYEEVLHHCHREGFSPDLVQEAPQMASVVNLVAAEMGVSIVPRSMAQVRVMGVAYVPFAGEGPVARLACAIRRTETAPAARNFLAMAADLDRPQVG